MKIEQETRPKVDIYLPIIYPPSSVHRALQSFLAKKRKSGLSEYSIIHLYASLWPLAQHFPELNTITTRELKAYTESLLRNYAPGTVRPVVGDIKQFFGWCKKKDDRQEPG